jgi:hypothetical protein
MIADRPKALLDDPSYSRLPQPPFAIDWSAVPELVKVSTVDLSGIQPITGARAKAVGGKMFDKPSAAEVELFRADKTQFQMVSLVASLIISGTEDGATIGRPFALTLIPASKRGQVQRLAIESVEHLDVDRWLDAQPVYAGYNPFTGRWGANGGFSTLMNLSWPKGFFDEIGFVIEIFFLTIGFDPADVLTLKPDMPSDEFAEKYRRYRTRLLFSPFQRLEARRIWGAESPIELFLAQGLAKLGLHPQLQMLVMEDGSIFPSWYHLWQNLDLTQSRALITEADMFFPDQRVAVFCDGSHHLRRKQREKDEAIGTRLKEVGITPVRVTGREINFDLNAAVEKVRGAVR